MYIPSEIILMVIAFMTKKQWKTLRLVSRDFHECMTQVPLFQELYFSFHEEDLVVFHGVCNNASLARHVTKILYDITWFPDLSLQQFRDNWPDCEYYTFEPRPFAESFKRFVLRRKKKKVVEHEQWLEEHPGPLEYFARLQHQKGLDQVQHLVCGMSKLPNLSGFYIESSQSEKTNCLYPFAVREKYGRTVCSSLTKTISAFRQVWRRHDYYPEPHGMYSFRHAPGVYTAEEIEFEDIMTAIQQSGARIEVLDVAPDASYLLYKCVSSTCKSLFTNLTSLSLNIHLWPYWVPGFSSRMFEMLSCAKGMQSLYLGFRRTRLRYWYPEQGSDDLEILMHRDLVLPCLHTLVLHQLSTCSATLYRILGCHSRTLKCLNLIRLDFSDTNNHSWTKMMKYMKSELDLGLVHLYPWYTRTVMNENGFSCGGWWKVVIRKKGSPRSLKQ